MFEYKKPLDKKQSKNKPLSKSSASCQTIQGWFERKYTPKILKCIVPPDPDEYRESALSAIPYTNSINTVETTVGIDSSIKMDGAGGAIGSKPYSERNGIYAYLPNYVKGHILNEQLGGEGVPENLFPFSKGTNSRHSVKIETPAKIARTHFVDSHNKGELFYYHCWLEGDAITHEVVQAPEDVDNITIKSECGIITASGQLIPVNTNSCDSKDYDPDFEESSISFPGPSMIHTRSQTEAARISERLAGFDANSSIAYQNLNRRFGNLKHLELLNIAQLISTQLHLHIDRDSKRHKIVLIKWFDENWNKINPIIDSISFTD